MDSLALSEQLASTVERISPSLVRIEARRRGPTSGVIWSAEGLVVTHLRAIEWEDGIQVGLSDGRTVGAKLVGRDPSTDVALLQLEGSGYQPISQDAPASLKVGHLVLALARPGRTARATWGIISALSEESWRTPLGGELSRYVESDLALGPGFGGGALVDAAGHFLGLTSNRFTRVGTNAIPTETLTRVVAALQAHGGIRRGYLGVGAHPVRLSAALEKTVGRKSGLILLSVEPDGPAEKAGLLLGDTLLSLDGKALEDVDDLLSALAQAGGNREVTLQLVRAGAVQDVRVQVGER